MTIEEKREKNRQYNILWRAKNKDKIRESQRLFDENHPERRKEIMKKFRDSHKERRHLERIEYRKTKSGKASRLCTDYKQFDKAAGRERCTLTQKWILENIFSGQKCIYCGDTNWKHLGCDRIDNSKPHTPDNVVCACGICNVERGDRYSVEEFIKYRKEHPIDYGHKQYEEIVDVNGVKVIRKTIKE